MNIDPGDAATRMLEAHHSMAELELVAPASVIKAARGVLDAVIEIYFSRQFNKVESGRDSYRTAKIAYNDAARRALGIPPIP